jgi:hypothetical protein
MTTTRATEFTIGEAHQLARLKWKQHGYAYRLSEVPGGGAYLVVGLKADGVTKHIWSGDTPRQAAERAGLIEVQR